MKCLVTGGAGFIGSHLVERLVHLGWVVTVIDNLSTGKIENIQKVLDKIMFIEGDIRDYNLLKKVINSIDIIFHQAALPSVPRSIQDPRATNEVNVNGTLNILIAAKEAGVERVIFASSSSVYGNTQELPKHEDMLPNPLSPYAVSKLAGEKYCQVFSSVYGLQTVVLRYFNVYGPRQDSSSQYSAVIPRFISAILNDEQPIIYGDGEQSRDFTYVSNVVEANILAAIKQNISSTVMNCACSRKISLNELVRMINSILRKNIQPIYEKERPGDIKHSFANIELIRKTLQYNPITTFEEGLRQTISWYIINGKAYNNKCL